MTCGAAECQRARHAKRSREWHAGNPEAKASHYQDVVVPFRREQPDYQQRWRWSRRLREIREKMTGIAVVVLASLRRLVGQAEVLIERTVGIVQTGAVAGEKLVRALSVVRSTIAALEQLESSTAELRELEL